VLSQQSCFEFLLQAVALAFDADRDRVVQHPVQNGTGDDLIAEDLAPVGQGMVRERDVTPGCVLSISLSQVPVWNPI